MKRTSQRNISIVVACNGLVFVGLNAADAWLTQRLLAIGGTEANWGRVLFDASVFSATNLMVVKVLLAIGVVLVLIRLGKAKLLWLLNVGISIVVLSNGICFLAYLAGLYGWFR